MSNAMPGGETVGANALELARRHLQKAVDLPAPPAQYFYLLAKAEFLAENLSQAHRMARRCVELEPAHYEAWQLLAETLLRLDRTQEAWEAAACTLKQAEPSEEAWLLVARTAMAAGRPGRAIKCLELYLKKSKDRLVGPLAYLLLAQVHLEVNSPRLALDYLEQAQARFKSFYLRVGPNFLALRARILRRLDQTDEALDFYQQALQQTPSDAALHNELGEALFEQGQFDNALKAFWQALQLEPGHAHYHYNAGRAARYSAAEPGQFSKRSQSLLQQALGFLEKATELNAVFAPYWYELALAYQDDGNFKRVREVLTQALAQSPGLDEGETSQTTYLRLYALACQRLGDFKGANETLLQLLEINPQDHQAHNELGELAYRLTQYNAAFNHFRRAEMVAADHPRYLANMSRVLLRLGRLEEARELVEEAAEVEARAQTGDYFVWHQLGAVWLESGQAAQALEPLREAAGHEPDNAEFRYYLGRAYLALGRVNEALHEYREALANAPLQHSWHAELGELYLHERLHLPALESLRLAHQIEPERPQYSYNLAIALAANGDVLGAIYTMREAMSRLPDTNSAEWHYLLGRLLLELGRLEEALASFTQAHNLDPANHHYKVDYARCLRLKGEPIERVKSLLEEALAIDPNGPMCLSSTLLTIPLPLLASVNAISGATGRNCKDFESA